MGDRDLITHGAHAVFAIGLSDVAKGPFRRIERTYFMESILTAGALVAPAGPESKVGFSAGIGFRWALPM